MIGRLYSAFRRIKSTYYYRWLPRCVDFLTRLATYDAKKRLRNGGVRRLLVDNTVLAHAVTHESAWVDTGKANWGVIEGPTGYLARVPVQSESDDTEAARSVRYLPGIACLAQEGVLILATSSELGDEQWTQPSGRFYGYGSYDYTLFSRVKLEKIRDPDYRTIIGAHPAIPSMEEQRSRRLKSKSDPLFRELVSVLGPNNSQDAWHISTAEHNDCYCFLTMDFRLIRNVRAQAGHRVIKNLTTRIMTPEEFGKEFGITPIPPRLFSYHDASFPVVHDYNWPDSKRRGRRRD